jgi:hypothetical protein
MESDPVVTFAALIMLSIVRQEVDRNEDLTTRK